MRAANLAASFLLALAMSLTAALGIAAAVQTHSPPSLMSRADYLAGARAIADSARLALAECRKLEPAERAVCRAEARADERIAAASLEAEYRGTVAAIERAYRVQSRAAHAIAQARRLAPT
jgi:hypothetical protein